MVALWGLLGGKLIFILIQRDEIWKNTNSRPRVKRMKHKVPKFFS